MGTLRVWDTVTRDQIGFYQGEVGKLAVSPNLNLFAAIDGITVTIFNVKTGVKVNEFKQACIAQLIKFSSNGSWIAAIDDCRHVNIWDANTAEAIFSSTLKGSDYPGIAFSPDDTILALVSNHFQLAQAMINLWDTTSWRHVGTLEVDGISFGVDFDATGNMIIDRGSDRYLLDALRLWDVNTQSEMMTFTDISGGGRIAINPQNQVAAVSGGTTFFMKFIDLSTTTDPLKDYLIYLDMEGGAFRQQFSPDGRMLLTVTYTMSGDMARLWGVPAN
jgi:WD40 repeat protein